VVLEIPGFPLDRTGTVLYLAGAVPVGLWWARRATVLASIKLFSPSSAAAVCGLLARRPFVALSTTIGPGGEVADLTATDGLGFRLRRALLRRAAALIAQTPAGAEELARIVAAEHTAVVPTPVEPVEAPDLTGEPAVLFAGRLSRDKGLPTLLEAWSTVGARRPGATLTLAGEGGFHQSLEPELRHAVEADEDLRRTVHFTGWVADVRPWLAKCDVFVLPSLQEGMSNALVEACAWGRVVVASDIPATRAVLGGGYPLLVPPGDSEALTAALLRALDDDSLRRDVRQQVLRRSEGHAVSAVCARLAEVLRSAARAYGDGSGVVGTAPDRLSGGGA
jgi:glycosyltransferase involved in cell wall biosynthesis